ncbi:MAG: aldehyde dehydrogenase family protein, partial [Cyclobacteriaceae bacterium]
MRHFQTINPFNQSQIESFQKQDISAVNALIDTAQQSFLDQKHLDLSVRGEKLLALSKLLEKNKKALGELMSKEMGKPLNQAISEVEKCVWVCEYYVENAPEFLSPKKIETEAYDSFVAYEPLGVILAIMPWNFPMWQVFRFLAPALMVGNTTLLKHAPNVLGTALRIQSFVQEAGFDKGTLQNLIIDVALVENVIAHKLVKGVTLTGSEAAGQSVAQIAGKHLKKCVLELGGSNAFIVHHDANIDKAVEVGIQARTQNNGQSCIAAKRFIIHNSIMYEYLDQFKEGFELLKCGDPMQESTDIGPLARPDLADKLETQVDDSIKAGAKLVMGGKREGTFYYPTILTSVKPGMPAFDGELFGPVAS